MKKLKKLSLKKETISKLENFNLEELKGGCSTNSSVCGGTTNTYTTTNFTQGKCDIPTIGHDDGPHCPSKTDWGWCWCYGI